MNNPQNKYPFPTKAQILASQASDGTCLEHFGILMARQTNDEHEEKTTKWKNRRGLMSSHAVRGTELWEKIVACEDLSENDVAEVRSIVSRYGKQLAAHYRDEMFRKNPGMQEVAAIFSAN
jgi:hypothetical protein